MKVLIIGSGGVAESLAHAINGNEKHELVGVAGRNKLRVADLAHRCKTQACYDLEQLPVAYLYIIAVSDAAIEQVAGQVNISKNAIIVHTAGSVDLQLLQQRHPNSGVLYPMQTFSQNKIVSFNEIPLFVEGANEEIQNILATFAGTLSEKTHTMSSEQRVKLHLAAVFCCNFLNAMLSATADLLSENKLSIELYKPLIEEMMTKAFAADHPRSAQTGPARRGDAQTQEKHIKSLGEKENLIEIYKTISKYIWETSKKI